VIGTRTPKSYAGLLEQACAFLDSGFIIDLQLGSDQPEDPEVLRTRPRPFLTAYGSEWWSGEFTRISFSVGDANPQVLSEWCNVYSSSTTATYHSGPGALPPPIAGSNTFGSV
jgi:hypothetical protein